MLSISPPQNINGNTFVFQPNIVRLPNGTVTMSFQTSNGHINMDHIGQLLSMILTGFDRPVSYSYSLLSIGPSTAYVS